MIDILGIVLLICLKFIGHQRCVFQFPGIVLHVLVKVGIGFLSRHPFFPHTDIILITGTGHTGICPAPAGENDHDR